MAFFWIFAIITVLILGLVFHRRYSYYTWGWNFLVVVLALYLGLYRVSGSPRNPCYLSALSNLHTDLEVLSVSYAAKMAVYLLVRTDPADEPIYVRLPWSDETAEVAMSAFMATQEDGRTLMVRPEILSRCRFEKPKDGQQGVGAGIANLNEPGDNPDAPKQGTEGGERMFYPKPVEADPFKQDTIHGDILVEPAPDRP